MVALGGGGFKGSGGFSASGSFRVVFERSGPDPYEQMKDVGIAVRDASVEAVVRTTETIKDRVRDYIDAHFTGSGFTRNSRRRASNAIRAHYYNDLDAQGSYAGLVYSKLGRGAGPASFVDYLLLHMFGGTIAPSRGDWLKILTPQFRGTFVDPDQVFFVPSHDGSELFEMIRAPGRGKGAHGRAAQLVATLVKQVAIPARLGELADIAGDRPELFEGAFAKAMDARGVTA